MLDNVSRNALVTRISWNFFAGGLRCGTISMKCLCNKAKLYYNVCNYLCNMPENAAATGSNHCFPLPDADNRRMINSLDEEIKTTAGGVIVAGDYNARAAY